MITPSRRGETKPAARSLDQACWVTGIAMQRGSALMAMSLVRPRERWIAGVCSGLARRFGLSAATMRLVFVISCLLPGPQFLLYIALWILMPSE
jgi:phage shock protein PspC (stress-responsive transcriptional regulator)